MRDFCHSDDADDTYAVLWVSAGFSLWEFQEMMGEAHKDPVMRITTTPIFVRVGRVKGHSSQIGRRSIVTSVAALSAASTRNTSPICTHVPGML